MKGKSGGMRKKVPFLCRVRELFGQAWIKAKSVFGTRDVYVRTDGIFLDSVKPKIEIIQREIWGNLKNLFSSSSPSMAFSLGLEIKRSGLCRVCVEALFSLKTRLRQDIPTPEIGRENAHSHSLL